jgi:hypothetical protein
VISVTSTRPALPARRWPEPSTASDAISTRIRRSSSVVSPLIRDASGKPVASTVPSSAETGPVHEAGELVVDRAAGSTRRIVGPGSRSEALRGSTRAFS